ncbi:MAG: toll/interleukin-1 receptor domain-containing protein, partial [Roseibium sp.]
AAAARAADAAAAAAADAAAAIAAADAAAAAADAATATAAADVVAAAAAVVDAATAAADAATARAAAAWFEIGVDCLYLEGNKKSANLISETLWLGRQVGGGSTGSAMPDWVGGAIDAFAKGELWQGYSWEVLAQWQMALNPANGGQKPRSLFSETANIEIATKPNEFWAITEERSAETILQHIMVIAGWQPEANVADWDFFLSYTEADEVAAKRISNVLEDEGYTVFSQFNDMTAGKSFVGEMNRGLEGMGRMIAVYSEDYFSSGPCTAEWEAAFLFDAAGEKGKTVPFMVRPCAPPPLAKRLVWTPLYGLSPQQERTAILDAVLDAKTPNDRVAQRALWKELISPDVTLDATEAKLDASANAVFDEPFAETDLLELPERLRALIKTALAALRGRNSPSGFPEALESYLKELDARGPNCIVGLLKDLMECIEAEAEAEDADYWCSGATLTTALRKIRENHALLIAHYPLDQSRERLLRAVDVAPEKYDPDASRNWRAEVLRATREAHENDLVTDEYRAAVENRDRVTRDILDLRSPQIPETEDEEYRLREEERARRVDDAKKRALAQQAGFADKSLDVLGKLTKIADSRSVQRLAKALQDLADWFW